MRIIPACTVLLTLAAVAGVRAEPGPRELLLAREADRTLAGTLLVPAAPAVKEPVLIVAGSGPTDRDGNSPLGVAAGTYRRLAEALAERGVMSLRTDKRGIGASRAALVREEDSTLQLRADDVRAWAHHLRATAGSRCVWLLGHSEGGLAALLAAADAASDGASRDLCGLILVATPGRRLGEVLRDQLRANPANAPILDEALHALGELEAGRRVDATGMHPALLTLFRPSVQPHLMSLLAFDPAARLLAHAGPALVMNGTTDLQVPVKDAERLARARPGVELVLLDGVNHVLKAAPADRAANLATYRDASLPLAAGVADPIVRFMQRHAPAARAEGAGAVTEPR